MPRPLVKARARVNVTATKPRIVATVPVSGQVGDIAVNPVTNRVYYTLTERGLGVLDGKTNKIMTTVPTGTMPRGVVVNARTNRVYVTNWLDGSLTIINGRTNRVVKTIPIGERCDVIALNPVTNLIYVASITLSSSVGRLTVIDGKTNAIVKRLSIQGRFSTLVVDEETNRIYFTNTSKDTVSVLDGRNQKILRTWKVGSNPVITPVLNKQTKLLYIPNNLSRYCSILDTRAGTVRKLQLGRLQSDIALNPATNRVYITSAQVESKGRLYVINGDTNRVVRRMTIPTSASLFLNPRSNRLYLSEFIDFKPDPLTVYNGTSLQRIAVLQPGESLGGTVVNVRTNRIYKGGENTLVVIQD
ncbi:YncE family protein [Paenibacillus methanolicus]|uniref:YVTN family beta-propeller protein n=1 Tax=Paenibacillus methanolicus TaxID=582686 RepID=A0A5S5C4T2_9BACL|nr:YncE family protein [Paenibacillus methanolicus]TYP73340.1 YVTN family beta-propeller protein [Paenibacillus methanolicus]